MFNFSLSIVFVFFRNDKDSADLKHSLTERTSLDTRERKKEIAAPETQKNFDSHICAKFFKKKDYLKRHLKTHTVEKPHCTLVLCILY